MRPQLRNVTTKLDPILRPESIFDPTDPSTSGRVVALTLVAQTKHPLARIPEFYGAGVYAIYYRGDFGTYAPLKGRDHPIYVGKADPDNQAAKDAVSQEEPICLVPCDHIPRRSWPLFRAKAMLDELIAELAPRSSSHRRIVPESSRA